MGLQQGSKQHSRFPENGKAQLTLVSVSTHSHMKTFWNGGSTVAAKLISKSGYSDHYFEKMSIAINPNPRPRVFHWSVVNLYSLQVEVPL